MQEQIILMMPDQNPSLTPGRHQAGAEIRTVPVPPGSNGEGQQR
jgi:hypothetical protein